MDDPIMLSDFINQFPAERRQDLRDVYEETVATRMIDFNQSQDEAERIAMDAVRREAVKLFGTDGGQHG